MPPASRVTDMHVCPMVTGIVPHVGGPILPPGAPTVLIGFLPAATVTNMLTCVGPPDIIIKGSAGVFINFLPAARIGDSTAHGGVIVLGFPTVIIGEIGAPSPGAGGAGAIAAGLVAAGLPGAAAGGSNTALLSTPAPAGTAPGGSGAPAWTQADIKANLDKCDGGTNVWSAAKTGSGGTEPVIQEGATSNGGPAQEAGNVITLRPGQTRCEATQYAVQELSNVSHNPEFNKIFGSDCQNGVRSRDQFIHDIEVIEYDGVQKVNKAFNACKDKWGCPATATSVMDWAKDVKSFDDYFNKFLNPSHKEDYGKVWDGSCKASWDAKHPPAPVPQPAPAAGVTPPSPPPPNVQSPEGNDSDDLGDDASGSDD